MIQKIYFPKNPLVRQIVNFFSYSEFDTDKLIDNWLGIFPNATANIAISLGDDLLHTNNSKNKSFISAACTKTLALKRTKNFKIISIQLNPFGLHHLLGIPMREIKNANLPSDVLFKASQIEMLHDKLHENDDITQRFQILEDFVFQQLRPKSINPRLPFAIRIMTDEGLNNMDKLSSVLCLSSRGLRKMFSQHIGMSPKYYSKMVRFNNAASQMLKSPEDKLTAIATDFGYFDQPHFIKDFKHFSGVSPSHFLNIRSNSTDFYNFVSEACDIFD
ncbi:helix-turn-helix domain-containing protein [Ulvibacterium marinum]|uniref:AraC family transcriptional regulator n=1 Tax=Ulvibacterium marinum TaxID=2419782 RepID=A0A3B0BWS8_9FLAO|nr:helix-turn-helix domain-containing protein [Ulvibacterium marinum]RKN77021.1 AraC family transcriptional regulator [Ulvibacterium marinum]